ncbi:MAG: ATP-binding cassette domain-containing protein [Bifidobacteriaceae bacterium]|jgi:peptide/nickel transport system ATP-binding protein|nr:ATP-binding cassette domain-containing protein [Bifidobacteriaceae bacterium]
MAEPLLKVRDLRVTYPGPPPVKAVRGISFDLYPGEVLGLVGESGCGKSTVARAVSGLLKPSHGIVEFGGNLVKPLTMRRRPIGHTGVQMVFQDPASSLNPRRRVGRQVADGLATAARRHADDAVKAPGLDRHPADDAVQAVTAAGTGRSALTPAEWLERVGLEAADASRFPRSFSGGQRQRIAIARALAAEPSLLIADEPISSLDASTQARVAGIMCQLAAEEDVALLFISHDLSIVRLIADRLLVMVDGQIVEEGPTDRIWDAPEHPYTRRLLASIPKPDGLGILPGG